MHADTGQVHNLVVHCTKCGVYNSTDRLSGRMAKRHGEAGPAPHPQATGIRLTTHRFLCQAACRPASPTVPEAALPERSSRPSSRQIVASRGNHEMCHGDELPVLIQSTAGVGEGHMPPLPIVGHMGVDADCYPSTLGLFFKSALESTKCP